MTNGARLYLNPLNVMWLISIVTRQFSLGIGKAIYIYIYIYYLNDLSFCKVECLAAMNGDDNWLWHKRLGHISMSILSKIPKMTWSRVSLKLSLTKIEFVMLVKWKNKLESLLNR